MQSRVLHHFARVGKKPREKKNGGGDGINLICEKVG
jgi:hypothetical protein